MPAPIKPETTFANPRNYALAKNALLALRPILDSLYPWYLGHGTLLGCVREHDLIRHDNDIDCPIHESADIQQVETALKRGGFFPLHKPSRPREFFYYGDCFGVSAALPGGIHSVEDPWDVHVDIWKQYTLNAKQVFEPFEKGPWVWVFDSTGKRIGGHGKYDKFVLPRPTRIIRVPFLGDEFPIPENYDEILTWEYGDWHTPVNGYTTTDSNDKCWGEWDKNPEGRSICT